MTGAKFVRLLLIIFVITGLFYYFTMPRGKDIVLVGVVDGNEVIVSPQITGRITNLTVDEGAQVKKGDLIAELDPRELQASMGAAHANVTEPDGAGKRGESQLRVHGYADGRVTRAAEAAHRDDQGAA